MLQADIVAFQEVFERPRTVYVTPQFIAVV